MSISRRRLAPLAVALAAGLLALSGPAEAQARTVARTDADSVSWVTKRQPLHRAAASLRTRDRNVALLLADTAIVLQFTDRGLDQLTDQVGQEGQGVGGRILARMVGAGLGELLDHGIAYRLSALRAARVENGRLVLEDRAGQHVFADSKVNGRDVMGSFAPAEAERFAAAVNHRIRTQR
jgi:hypothetical protein